MNREYEQAAIDECKRLEIARKWANINRSEYAKQFDQGRSDRLQGKGCLSANGAYLNGWYSVERS